MIGVEERGEVAVVRLDHGRVNALDLELPHALIDAMAGLVAGPAVVLTGTGGVFSTGVDLRRIVAGGPGDVREFLPVGRVRLHEGTGTPPGAATDRGVVPGRRSPGDRGVGGRRGPGRDRQVPRRVGPAGGERRQRCNTGRSTSAVT